MKVSTEKLEGSRVALAVEAPEDVVEESLRNAYRSVVKRVTVPGFRKGKTPRSVLERYYGKEVLAEEALREVLPEQYRLAVAEAGIEPVDEPEFDDVVFEQGQPLKFTARVTVRPEVELASYEDLAVPFETPAVTDEDIDQQLDMLRGRMSELRPLGEGAVLEPGLFASCHVKGIEGADFTAEIDQDLNYIEVGRKAPLVPGLEEALQGMKKGETKEFTGEYPSEDKASAGDEAQEQAQEEQAEAVAESGEEEQPGAVSEIVGRRARFSVAVLEAYEKHQPDNDELVKNLGKTSLEEVREEIEKNIFRIRLEQALNHHTAKVEEELVARASVEIPQVMVGRKAEDLVNRFAERLQGAGIPFERYLESTGRSFEDVFKEFEADAGKEVRATLVLDAATEREQTEVSEEAVDEVVAAIARETGQDPQAVKTTLDIRGSLHGIRRDLARIETLRKIARDAAEKAGTPVPDLPSEEGAAGASEAGAGEDAGQKEESAAQEAGEVKEGSTAKEESAGELPETPR